MGPLRPSGRGNFHDRGPEGIFDELKIVFIPFIFWLRLDRPVFIRGQKNSCSSPGFHLLTTINFLSSASLSSLCDPFAVCVACVKYSWLILFNYNRPPKSVKLYPEATSFSSHHLLAFHYPSPPPSTTHYQLSTHFNGAICAHLTYINTKNGQKHQKNGQNSSKPHKNPSKLTYFSQQFTTFSQIAPNLSCLTVTS